MTPNRNKRIRVRTIEIPMEPVHPSRLEKKKNIAVVSQFHEKGRPKPPFP
jgi:hypothetical protein